MSPNPPDRSRRNLDHGRIGFMYLLTNPSMPGLIKAGCTRKHPLQRVKELCAATGVPTPFTLAYYLDFSDAFLAESLFHEHFAEHRVNEGREFFRVGLTEAIGFVSGLCNSSVYRDLVGDLSSEGVSGGESVPDYGPPVETPFAELFATFLPDDGSPRELTPEEQRACRQLTDRLAARQNAR